MLKQTTLVVAILTLLVFIQADLSLAQEAVMPQEEIPIAETEVEWLWGEVVSVDTTNGAITVKYLDYETDAEKEMTVMVNAQTLYENVKSLDEIKQMDTVSIDYIVDLQGKNVAQYVSVEKPESQAEPPQAQPQPPEEVSIPAPEGAEAEEPQP